MYKNWKPVLGAAVAITIVTAIGVPFFFNPVSAGDSGTVLVHPALAFLTYIVLYVALFHWTASVMNSPYRAAFVIGASQFILVNVDMVLTGKRGLMTAGASSVLLAATWVCVAFVYSRLGGSDGKKAE